MLTYFGAPDAGVPCYPIAALPVLVPVDTAGALLDELDTLIAAYDTALAVADDAARQVAVLRERIALTRAALALAGGLACPLGQHGAK